MRRAALIAACLFAGGCGQGPVDKGSVPSPAVSPTARPGHATRAKPRRRPTQGLILETPVPDAVLEPTETPEVNLVPTDKHLLEQVAFKRPSEVQELLGDPDQAYKQGKLLSWYYMREEPGSEGRKVCPEVRFIEGTARLVIFWTPEAMRGKIAVAQRNDGTEPGHGQESYAFTDSFKYLAVGTPQSVVLRDLGEPDARRKVEDNEEWDYDTTIVENGAARSLTVVIKDQKVVEVRGR